MRICKIWDADYPWDVRVEKVALALTAAGHDVHLIARNRKRRPVLEALPEATVHRLPAWRWMSQGLDAATMFPAFFNPRWLAAVAGTAGAVRADILLCRDVPLAPTAIWAGRRLGLPVVLDIAENYPAMTQSLWDNGVQKPWDWLVRNPRAVRLVENWVLKRVDHILVVVEESRDRIVGLGVRPDRVTIVGNTPGQDRLDAPPRQHRSGAPLSLIYLGLLEAPRGIEVVLRGVAQCVAKGLPVRLQIIGDGRERQRFEALALSLGLGPDVVRFLGFMPYSKALELVRQADVGLVPHLANESWNTTIPNKLFDYMAAGLAVITSDAKPAARVIHETGGGEVYRDREPATFAAAVSRLADVDHRARCGARAREAIERSYNWGRDGARLVAALEAVSRGNGC